MATHPCRVCGEPTTVGVGPYPDGRIDWFCWLHHPNRCVPDIKPTIVWTAE